MVKVLRDKFQDEKSCLIAAASAKAALLTDVVDFSGTTSVLDTVTGIIRTFA